MLRTSPLCNCKGQRLSTALTSLLPPWHHRRGQWVVADRDGSRSLHHVGTNDGNADLQRWHSVRKPRRFIQPRSRSKRYVTHVPCCAPPPCYRATVPPCRHAITPSSRAPRGGGGGLHHHVSATTSGKPTTDETTTTTTTTAAAAAAAFNHSADLLRPAPHRTMSAATDNDASASSYPQAAPGANFVAGPPPPTPDNNGKRKARSVATPASEEQFVSPLSLPVSASSRLSACCNK